jgi:hypothetical protein
MARLKRWRNFAALGVKDHVAGQRRPVLALTQGTENVGNPLRQHRDDAVREIGGVAAFARLAVEGGLRAHIGRNVGNGDDDLVATRVVRGRRRERPTRRRRDRGHRQDQW